MYISHYTWKVTVEWCMVGIIALPAGLPVFYAIPIFPIISGQIPTLLKETSNNISHSY